MKRLRFFYLPNETTEGDQIGPRKAFRTLHEAGHLSAYTAYSYLVERAKAPSHERALRDLRAAVEAFQPDVIYWQHLNGSYPVDAAYLRSLKAVASQPKLVWHDPEALSLSPLTAKRRCAGISSIRLCQWPERSVLRCRLSDFSSGAAKDGKLISTTDTTRPFTNPATSESTGRSGSMSST